MKVSPNGKMIKYRRASGLYKRIYYFFFEDAEKLS